MDPVVRAVEPAGAVTDPGELPVRLRGHDGDDAAGEDAPLGHDFVPDPIHAGGLRYHGMAPLVSLLKEEGIIEAESLQQTEAFGLAVQFARAEGIIPGPEPAHAVASAMMEAEQAKEAGEEKVIVFNLSGHGHFDMAAYQEYLEDTLTDYEHPGDRIAAAMERVPVVAG